MDAGTSTGTEEGGAACASLGPGGIIGAGIRARARLAREAARAGGAAASGPTKAQTFTAAPPAEE
jgi:hypothetical protein